MAVYTVNAGNPVGATWVTLPTPTADAWIQATNGDIRLTTAAVPNAARAFKVTKDVPFPIRSGSSGVKISAASGLRPVLVIMEDKP